MGRRFVVVLIILFSSILGADPRPAPDDAGFSVEGVWKLEKIISAGSSVDTEGGFIFLGGFYSTTVHYSFQETQTNISQFGSYAVEGDRLSLAPMVHVSTRAQTVIYEPEPPFSLDITIIGDEMRGVAIKNGSTFVFRRLH